MTLIERLESATEPSRELDRLIWKAIGGTIKAITEVGGHTHERWTDADGVRWAVAITNFTDSLDAALGLVPEGWCGNVDFGVGEAQEALMWNGSFGPGGQETEAMAATPALALCAAAFRARQADV